ELGSAEPAMKETAWWIASRHPEWGAALAGTLGERLDAKSLGEKERQELVQQLARFARSAAAQQMLAERLQDPAASPEARRTVLRAMAQSGLRDTPPSWVAALTHLLGTGGELVAEAVAAARTVRAKQRPEQLAGALMKLAQNDKLPPLLRVQ